MVCLRSDEPNFLDIDSELQKGNLKFKSHYGKKKSDKANRTKQTEHLACVEGFSDNDEADFTFFFSKTRFGVWVHCLRPFY